MSSRTARDTKKSSVLKKTKQTKIKNRKRRKEEEGRREGGKKEEQVALNLAHRFNILNPKI